MITKRLSGDPLRRTGPPFLRAQILAEAGAKFITYSPPCGTDNDYPLKTMVAIVDYRSLSYITTIDMKLSLNDEAAKNFDKKAENLLTEISARPTPDRRSGPADPDLYVSAHIPEKDLIGGIKFGQMDYLGRESAKFWDEGITEIGLFEEGYKNLVRIAEGMQRTEALRDKVSVELLTDLMFDWLEKRYKKVLTIPMTEYVLGECEKRVEELEIWLPISELTIASEIVIGKITLKTITRKMMDDWQAQGPPKTPEHEAMVKQFIDQRRREMQRKAAATIKLVAEPERASQIAFEEAERAISMLRFFSPANFDPQLVSYCGLLGTQHFDLKKVLIIREREGITFDRGFADGSTKSWELSNAVIQMYRTHGLDTLNNLLNKPKRSKFQQDLIDALLLYSRSSLAKNFSDKLVYILIAIESMFLKNSSEPLGTNIGERMAYFAGHSAKEREEIADNVTKIYGLRSSFLHHGRTVTIDHVGILEDFMLTAWRCLQGLIVLAENDETTKEALLSKLEKLKWG
jgi:hypothetical protein